MQNSDDVQSLFQGIKGKKLPSLARAITLVESKNPNHKEKAKELLRLIIPHTGKAKRIGISGTPGVGKSTFLENFGMHLISQGNKLAVLAIDPTSQLTGGSILGDKTRMANLSAHANAFVRPSPNGATLGGIAAKTREAMLLCDAFGFDYIFVETVGVGQSEISVSHFVDMFILLMQPGGGDELQGIKRGILEISDLIIVNKADGTQEQVARVALHDYEKSLDVLQEKRDWRAPVLACSSLKKSGFEEIYQVMVRYFEGFNSVKRQGQLKFWLRDLIQEKLETKLNQIDWDKETDLISQGKEQVLDVVEKVFQEVFKND